MVDVRRTNQDRAEQVDEVLSSYERLSGDDPTDQVSDLLADVLHWCNDRDISFTCMFETALMHYSAELAEEGHAVH